MFILPAPNPRTGGNLNNAFEHVSALCVNFFQAFVVLNFDRVEKEI